MKISFIGHGNMAKAMIKGIINSGMIPKSDIFASDTDEENQIAVDFADYVFLTIKPFMFSHVIPKLTYTKDKVFITVSPGIKTDFIDAKVIRTMPNTPALVGEGVTAVCRGATVTDTEFAFVKKLLSTFSAVYEFKESMMDYTIALSGSSPAYAYMLIDAMTDYSAKHGINPKIAKKMAAQTILGAAKMVLESSESPATLRDQVCTKGGTTIQAVEKFREMGLADMVAQAMEACTARALEMAKGSS